MVLRPSHRMPPPELSVVLPCLNEAETLARCIEKAKLGFARAGVRGEVIVADNGSTDGSRGDRRRPGARVVPWPRAATAAPSAAASMPPRASGSSWATRTIRTISPRARNSSTKLREGHDLVMGCRLPSGGGTIAPGAMPWKNRWLGNPFLSSLGRLFFRTPIRDFHCGLRAFTRAAYQRMS